MHSLAHSLAHSLTRSLTPHLTSPHVTSPHLTHSLMSVCPFVAMPLCPYVGISVCQYVCACARECVSVSVCLCACVCVCACCASVRGRRFAALQPFWTGCTCWFSPCRWQLPQAPPGRSPLANAQSCSWCLSGIHAPQRTRRLELCRFFPKRMSHQNGRLLQEHNHSVSCFQILARLLAFVAGSGGKELAHPGLMVIAEALHFMAPKCQKRKRTRISKPHLSTPSHATCMYVTPSAARAATSSWPS